MHAYLCEINESFQMTTTSIYFYYPYYLLHIRCVNTYIIMLDVLYRENENGRSTSWLKLNHAKTTQYTYFLYYLQHELYCKMNK